MVENANEKYNKFFETYENCYRHTFPKKIKKVSKPRLIGKPSIMIWLQEVCDRKNKLYATFIKQATEENKEKYIKYKKWVEKRIYIAKRKFYTNQITKYNANAKKQSKVINEIINRRKSKPKITKIKIDDNEVTNSHAISNHFNTYFCNIATKLKSEINSMTESNESGDNINVLNYLKVCQCTNRCTCRQPSIFLEPCSESEITTIIKELNNSSTSDFNTTVLKSVSHDIAKPLTEAVNASLSQGVFPTILKLTKTKYYQH